MLPGEFIVDTNSERWINTRKGLLKHLSNGLEYAGQS